LGFGIHLTFELCTSTLHVPVSGNTPSGVKPKPGPLNPDIYFEYQGSKLFLYLKSGQKISTILGWGGHLFFMILAGIRE